MIKILKNESGALKTLLGVDREDGEQYTIPVHKWLEAYQAMDDQLDLYSDIVSGDVVVNDGSTDLNPSEGEAHLQKLQAHAIPEDHTHTEDEVTDLDHFDADAIHDNIDSEIFNIEEKTNPDNNDLLIIEDSGSDYEKKKVKISNLSSNDPLLGSLIQAVFLDNGSTGNEWYKCYGENQPSNQSPYIVPFDCRLVGITYSNKNAGVDSDIEVWASALGDGTTKTKVFDWTVNNKRIGYKTNFTTPYIEFDAGDKVSVYNDDNGTNGNDTRVILYLQILNNNTDEEWENYSGYQGGGSTS